MGILEGKVTGGQVRRLVEEVAGRFERERKAA